MSSLDTDQYLAMLKRPLHHYRAVGVHATGGWSDARNVIAWPDAQVCMEFGIKPELLGRFDAREGAALVAVPLRARIRTVRRLLGLDVSSLEA